MVTKKILLAGFLFAAALIFVLRQNSFGSPGSHQPGPGSKAKEKAKSQPVSLVTSRQSPTRYRNARQLTTVVLPLDDLHLPPDLAGNARPVTKAVAGRRMLEKVPLSELDSPDLLQRAVPLPQADTLSGFNFGNRRFGRLQTAAGTVQLFNPETVLVKFKEAQHVAAIRVDTGQELAAARELARRSDVEFAELDSYENRQAFPNDPLVTNQWHHQILGSAQAWAFSQGQGFIRIAIVDAPFQMGHPDLSAHVVDGWDVDQNVAVTNSSGIDHSTLCAGLAAAVINNEIGIAGMGNCTILPININGAISEMYNAVIWAADHGVRVVNISWTGGDSDALNTAGAYLEATDRGVLVMPAGNQGAAAYTTNQPDIYCISMTDAADNMQSLAGPQVDFAAPGWNIYSTLTGSGYGLASGTSYSAPIFAGVIGVLLSINPTLGPDDVIAILKETAYQPNGWPQGQWNEFYGWGRINFASAAAAAEATLPAITSITLSNSQAHVTANYQPGPVYSLWRSASLIGSWSPVTNALAATNGNTISFVDSSPPTSNAFYRINIAVP